jgi:hypothetical protein
MTLEEVEYIFEHCTEFILPEEQTAMALLGLSAEEKDRSFWKLDLTYGKVDNHRVKELTRLGEEKLKQFIVQRIAGEQGNKILNYCPKCNRLARTPLAKQCRYCGHDWHENN